MKTNAINSLKKTQHHTATKRGAFLVFSTFIASLLLVSGCATTPPLTQLESSLITQDPQKASVLIYRSTEESLAHRVFVDIHIDGQPFIRLIRGEYTQTYLPVGNHIIKVKYNRYAGSSSTAEDQEMIDLKLGDVVYMEIVPSFDGWDWVCGVTYFPMCLPMPSPKVELVLASEEEAQKVMGKRVDIKLITERRVIKY